MSDVSPTTGNCPNLFTSPMILAEEDVFSSTADDCILSVFSFLNRESLDIMKGVSQKMNVLANNAMLNGIKTQSLQLVIIQEVTSHSFFLNPWGLGICLACHVKSTEDRIEAVERKIVDPLWDWEISLDRLAEDVTPVPSLLFENLQKVCEKRHFSFLLLRNIYIDENFLRLCSSIIELNTMESLEFQSITFDDDVNARKLARFILASKATSTDLNSLGSIIDDLLTVDFLDQISSSQKHFGKYSILSKNRDINNSLRIVSSDQLSIICRFRYIRLPSMVLNADQVLDLIVKGFQSNANKISWNFTVDGSISIEQLEGRIDSERGDLVIVSMAPWSANTIEKAVIRNRESSLYCVFEHLQTIFGIVFNLEECDSIWIV